MENMQPNLLFHLGTSGWSYRWQEVLYPLDLKSADFLNFYATRFNCVEINSSFYHYTMAKTIEKWLASTPDHFRFAPKLHRDITHHQKWQDVAAPLEKFMGRYLLMGERLGPVLVQIAGSFRFDEKISGDFYKLLRDKYPDQPFALEARHASWFTDESLDLLREHNITWVITSGGKRFPGLETTTNHTAYLRLHGEERLYASAYTDEQLERYAYMVQDWLEDNKEVWVFFNNTMFGNAVTDADKLRGLVGSL